MIFRSDNEKPTDCVDDFKQKVADPGFTLTVQLDELLEHAEEIKALLTTIANNMTPKYETREASD